MYIIKTKNISTSRVKIDSNEMESINFGIRVH